MAEQEEIALNDNELICVETYNRLFWVGVTERNTAEGRAAVAQRIKSLFNELKKDEVLFIEQCYNYLKLLH